MILGLVPLTLFFEVIPILNEGNFAERFQDMDFFWNTTYYVLIGSVLAFLMEISEYLLLSYTSSLTLSIAGIIKEIFTLYLAVNINGDEMSLINFIGFVICLTGITLHVILKTIDASGKIRSHNYTEKANMTTLVSGTLLIGAYVFVKSFYF